MSLMIARRYARAVFDLGREKGTLPALCQDLDRFAAAYEASAELRELERMPSLTDEQRRAAVTAIGERLGASEAAVRTVAMLAERQRLSLLPDVAWILGELSDRHAGLLRATVTSAKPLSADYLSRLRAAIESATGKKVDIETAVDPSLIAGVTAQIGDRIIDGSVRGRLERLGTSLKG